jgi:hypothetical protein
MAQITVTLSPATLAALDNLGYALYVLRAYNTTNAASKPLVWLADTQLTENVVISFDIKYKAYVSVSRESSIGDIVAMSAVPVVLGETATVDGEGTFTITQGSNPSGVTIVNGSTRPYTSGLAAAVDDVRATPLLAEPLYGLAENINAPLDRFLLAFSTQGIGEGTPIAHAMSQGLLVDLAGADQRTMAFDINTGWGAGDVTWAKTVPAGADLTPILVHVVPMRSAPGA